MTDVSEQAIGPIFDGQTFCDCLPEERRSSFLPNVFQARRYKQTSVIATVTMNITVVCHYAHVLFSVRCDFFIKSGDM